MLEYYVVCMRFKGFLGYLKFALCLRKKIDVLDHNIVCYIVIMFLFSLLMLFTGYDNMFLITTLFCLVRLVCHQGVVLVWLTMVVVEAIAVVKVEVIIIKKLIMIQ